jgi:hypothetical protein
MMLRHRETWHWPGQLHQRDADILARRLYADDPSCTPTFVSAGQAFMEKPGHVHFARNEGTMPEQHVSTYVVPLGSPLVTDAPNPGNCPF